MSFEADCNFSDLVDEGLHFKPSPHIALPQRKFEGNEKMGFDEVCIMSSSYLFPRAVIMSEQYCILIQQTEPFQINGILKSLALRQY